MRLNDLLGRRFSMAKVISRAPRSENPKDTNARWNCECDCGKKFVTYGQDLVRGRVKSCGCYTRKTFGQRTKHGNTTHGLSSHKVYNVWTGMMNRCYHEKGGAYVYYGARGIKVCDRWHQFENFVSDMGFPGSEHSLDRIDVNGNYSPENCRWATRTEQCRNRRTTIRLTHDGLTLTLTEWGKKLGVSVGAMKTRMNAKFPPEKLFAPNMKRPVTH